jgi:GNAT superfamily N-acetyltransferase
MHLIVERAGTHDAPAIAAIRTAAADVLTARYGEGRGHARCPLTRCGPRCVGHVLVARLHGTAVATLTLQSRKPGSIDASAFTNVSRALYLVDMAVDPELQRRGVGRLCLTGRPGAHWPADAIGSTPMIAKASADDFTNAVDIRLVGTRHDHHSPRRLFEQLLTSR